MASESGLEAAAVAASYVPPLAEEREARRPDDAPADSVLARLFAEPWTFEFFQAVRLLEQLQPERAPVGGFEEPRHESIRFASATGVGFPASEIQGLAAGEPPRMAVNFLGLTGPQGMLPLAYSLYVAERLRSGDQALKSFLEIFDHRMLSLFYRAWEKTHVAVAYNRPDRDWLTRHLLDVVGLGTPAMQGRLPIPDGALLAYAGLFASSAHSAAGLEQILSDYFRVPVAVEQFVGAWYPLSRSTQSELGDETLGSALGLGAVAGDEIWDQQSRVRVRIGPLARAQYETFLPGGSAHEPLQALTQFYTNGQIDFEIQLVLTREDVPSFRLDDATPLPLSWCTWLRTTPMTRDPDDAVFTL
jgi:type VI secretion system protein ImpH